MPLWHCRAWARAWSSLAPMEKNSGPVPLPRNSRGRCRVRSICHAAPIRHPCPWTFTASNKRRSGPSASTTPRAARSAGRETSAVCGAGRPATHGCLPGCTASAHRYRLLPAGLAVQPDGKYLWAGEAKIVTVGYSENNSTGATRRGPRPLSRPIAVAGGWAEKRITAVNAMTRPSRICPSSSLSFVTA
jgi:hypothetical protein